MEKISKIKKILTSTLAVSMLFFATSYGANAHGANAQPVAKPNTKNVVVCGTPIGIKMYCSGVMVVELQEIPTPNGKICPAKKAGIQKGDIIKSINNRGVSSNFELISIVRESKGKALPIEYEQDGKLIRTEITPVNSQDNGGYKIGAWVRDSAAGIGTVTYYDKETKQFAALGHAICDADTGDILPITSGTPVNICIDDIEKSTKGCAGCLMGHFTSDIKGGVIAKNTTSGIFGYMDQAPSNGVEMQIAKSDEIACGEAQILTTIDAGAPKYYNVQIESINLKNAENGKNFVIRITDKELLSKTGGIVHGMSGSPIIQNNKLIGAVTHVFINSPDRGYGIFIDNMISETKALSPAA